MPRKSPPRAKPRAPLSKERVLRCAVGLADAGGIDSLSMRKLAESLGVEAMSLYNHVANKEEILGGIVELIMSEIHVPAGDDWKAALRRRALSAHEVLLRHPWAPGLIESRTSHGPAGLKQSDAVLGVLRGAGFSLEHAYQAFLTLDSYVYGFTLQEVAFPHAPADVPAAVERLRPEIPASEYPHIAEMMGFVVRMRRARGRQQAYEAEFEFGLDLILDGLERVRDQSSARGARRSARGRAK